jgi:nucleotide-binding universal stress UspA family protein
MKLPIKTILVAVDFSEPSEAALDAAIGIAKQFGAELHLVHAYSIPIPMVTPYEVAIPDVYLDETRKAAQDRLAKCLEKAKQAGLTAEAHMTEGVPHIAIEEAAKSVGAQLIVMGTHGHTGLTHVVLGSVAERTLRHAPCSVLTVKGDAG